MIGKIVGNRFGALVLGLILLAISLLGMDPSKVTCGSQEMHPGDECSTTRRGSTTVRTYEEQRDYDNLMRNIMMGVGGVLVVGGVVAIVLKARRKPETSAVAA